MESNVPSSKPKENPIIIVCPKCLRNPLIEGSKKEPDHIKVTCSCGYKEDALIKNYMRKVKKYSSGCKNSQKCELHPEEKAEKFCYQCELWLCCTCAKSHSLESPNHYIVAKKTKHYEFCFIHTENKAISFCDDCCEYICQECEDEHFDHFLEQKMMGEDRLTNIKKSLERNSKKIVKLNESLKNFAIDYLKSMIQEVESVYLKNLNANNEIIKFTQLLIDSYSNSKICYASFVNLDKFSEGITSDVALQNHEFLIREPPIEISKIITYFETSYINGVIEKDVIPRISNVEGLRDTSSWVGHLLLLKDGRFLTCNGDSTMKVFAGNLHMMSIKGHQAGVRYATQLTDGRVVSCSLDKTIKMWDIKEDNYTLLATFLGHIRAIRKVIQINSSQIASCSEDGTIRIWETNSPFKLCRTLLKHIECVSSIIKTDRYLISASYDYTIRFWIQESKEEFNCVGVVDTIQVASKNGMIIVGKNKLVGGGHTEIVIINIDTFQEESRYALSLGQTIYCIFQFNENTLLLGGGNGNMYEFDIIECKIKFKKEKFHNSCIDSIISNSFEANYLSSSFDGEVLSWSVGQMLFA